MIVYDQFETDSGVAYSGSYVDTAMFGDMFVSSQTYLSGFTPLGQGSAKTSRRILASKASRNTYPNVNRAWLPVYVLEGFATGSFLGRPQKFLKLTTDKEVWYDSYMPNAIKIQQVNGASPSGLLIDGSTSSGRPELSGSDWGIFPIINTATTFGSVNAALAFDSLPYSSHSSTSDYIWEATFPFESRYKLVDRLFKFSKVFPESYTISITVDETPITPSSSSNIIGSITKMTLDTDGLGSTFPAQVIGHMVTPTVSWPSYSLATDTFTVGTVSDRDFFNCFFGTGDGDGVRSSKKGPFLRRFHPTVPLATRSANVIPRGYKYGIRHVQPEQPSAVYRMGRFGQFRDMLEQRLVSKFRVGTNAIYAPVLVNFISGTQIFPQTLDYVTATNPSYNRRDSGIWDAQYRSGQPFFDTD